jgi:hypothetical protein
MSYDHSSETPQLALPNPYRIQNALLLLAGALLVGGGVQALWWARAAIANAQVSAAAPTVVGIALTLAGLSAWVTAARRLRFFFGRGRPRSLADEVAVSGTGQSPKADALKEDLRQATIVYPEPQGPIEGLLYHLAPRLITSPTDVQNLARSQFFNLLALLAALASFAVAWFLTPNAVVRAWLSLGYALFSLFFLIRPVVFLSRARMSTAWLVVLLVAAILAPVGISLAAKQLPSLGTFTLERHVWAMLIGGIAAVGLTVLATMKQVSAPPKTQTSVEQLRLSMQTPPSALIDELDRYLQSTWTERIPSRRYARTEPLIDPSRHSAPFSGEILEETQPMPLKGSVPPSLGTALRSSRHRWLVAIDIFALALTVAALWMALDVAKNPRLDVTWQQSAYSNAGLAAVLLLLAAFSQRMAAHLWGRFDFESALTWVEIAGTYQTSSMNTGSVLSRMSTQSQIVRTESMTLRVWRARIESVVFGKDGERQITAMFSTDADTKALAQHLVSFGQSQSNITAPTAAEDLRRLGTLASAESALAPHARRDDGLEGLLGSVTPKQAEGSAAYFCSACGAQALRTAKFCSECGSATGQALA